MAKAMRSTRQPDWRDSSTLHDLNFTQAVSVLGQISEHFRQSTRDAAFLPEHNEIASIDASEEAVAFANSANALGAKLRGAGQRQAADAKRYDKARKLTADEEAAEFAANARALHRK
jgi:hypothetical protein